MMKPDSSMMASLASAVSAPRNQRTAWPMRLPGGAVTPAMKPTMGFFMLVLHHRAASASSGPPISPIMMTASVSGSSLKAFITSMCFEAIDGVATNAHSGGLAQTHFGQHGHGFIRQRARTAHHADAALAVDVAGHDADLDFVGVMMPGSWGPAAASSLPAASWPSSSVAHFEHVTHRNAFGDADGHVQVGVHGFPDGSSSIPGHIDHRDGGAGLRCGFL